MIDIDRLERNIADVGADRLSVAKEQLLDMCAEIRKGHEAIRRLARHNATVVPAAELLSRINA